MAAQLQRLDQRGFHRYLSTIPKKGACWRQLPPLCDGLALLGDPARGRQRQATPVVEDRLRTQLGRSSSCSHVAAGPVCWSAVHCSSGLPSVVGPVALVPYSCPSAAPTHLRSCRRRRRLDLFGDHRTACGCGAAGARVTVGSRLADMNLPVDRLDDRRQAWPWPKDFMPTGGTPRERTSWRQPSTLVSPLRRDGSSRSREWPARSGRSGPRRSGLRVPVRSGSARASRAGALNLGTNPGPAKNSSLNDPWDVCTI